MNDFLTNRPPLAKYSGLDYDTIRDDVLSQLVSQGSSYNNFSDSDPGRLLINAFAVMYDQLAFYMDRRVTNLYLDIVRAMREASMLARQVGYKVSPAIASSVDFTIALSAVRTFDVLLPAGTPIPGPRGLIYELARDTTFITGNGPSNTKKIPAYEGRTVVETFFSNGQPNQVYQLFRVPKDKFIVVGTVEVQVNGVEWEEQDLLGATASNQFSVNYAGEPPELQFGDGVVGAIPAQGNQIKITYVVSSGANGKIAARQINTTFKISQSLTQVQFSVVNEDRSIGGDGMEQLSSVQANAGRRFRARLAAVTAADYEALSIGFSHPLFGRVAAARAYSPRSAANDVELNNQLTAIRSTFESYGPAVQALVDSGQVNSAAIVTKLTELQGLIADVGAKITEIDNAVTTAVTATRTARGTTNEIDSVASQVALVGGELTVELGDITVGGADVLTTDTRALLLEKVALLTSYATSLQTKAASALTSEDSALVELKSIATDVEEIGTSGASAGSLLESIETVRTSISTETTSIDAVFTAIEAVVVNTTDDIDEACDALFTHFNRALSSDCKVNMVQVPILARDSAGNLVAPTLGLVAALQERLDTKRSVTQTVSVTSGENQLFPAVVEITASIKRDFRETVTEVDIIAAVETVIRNKTFNQPLYLRDLYSAIEQIEGLDFFNVTITGHLDDGDLDNSKLDDKGNLIVSEQEVVTVGTVTVTTTIV